MEINPKALLQKLRKQAEEIAQGKTNHFPLLEREVQDIFHEFQVQQIELEMQNDELLIANEEIEKQRLRFLGLYDLAPVGYFILNRSSMIEEVNTTGLHLINTSKSKVINQRFQNFISDLDGEKFYNFIHRIINNNNRQSCQILLIPYKSEPIYCQIEGQAIRENIGREVKIYLAVIDITERRKSELKLLETKESLQLALDASGTGTWNINVNTGEVFFDEFIQRLIGLKPGEFNGTIHSFLSHIHVKDRRVVRQSIKESLEGGKELDIEFCLLRTQKRSSYIYARGHIVEREDAKYLIGTLTDVTEKKLLETEANNLKLNQQKAIIAAELQVQENERKRISETLHDSVSQLLYAVQLKLDSLHLPVPEYKEPFQNINKLIREAIKETRNISFELAPSILTDFGLGITLEEMAKRLSTKTLHIQTKVTGLKRRLRLETETNIFRIIQELVNNSIRHAQATLITVELLSRNKLVEIVVRDNGIGFDSKEKKTYRKGSGLSSIKNRVGLFNGKMLVESNPGKGTATAILLRDITY